LPCQSPGQARVPEPTGRRQQRLPEPASAEHPEHKSGLGAEAVGLDQAFARRLESLAVAHAGGADRLAPAAAEAGIEMLEQGRVVGREFAAFERAHQHNAAPRAV
jgi:hypothetical protein